MSINLADYQSTGTFNNRILQLGLSHVKSVEGHRLHNHLNKIDSNWLKDYIIVGEENKLVTSDLQHEIEIEGGKRPQFLVAVSEGVERFESVIRTRLDVKDEGIVNYFMEKTEFTKLEKKENVRVKKDTVRNKEERNKQGNEEQGEQEGPEKITKKAFVQLALEQKQRNRKLKQRISFLKRRKARMLKEKQEKQKSQKNLDQNDIQQYLFQQ